MRPLLLSAALAAAAPPQLSSLSSIWQPVQPDTYGAPSVTNAWGTVLASVTNVLGFNALEMAPFSSGWDSTNQHGWAVDTASLFIDGAPVPPAASQWTPFSVRRNGTAGELAVSTELRWVFEAQALLLEATIVSPRPVNFSLDVDLRAPVRYFPAADDCPSWHCEFKKDYRSEGEEEGGGRDGGEGGNFMRKMTASHTITKPPLLHFFATQILRTASRAAGTGSRPSPPQALTLPLPLLGPTAAAVGAPPPMPRLSAVTPNPRRSRRGPSLALARPAVVVAPRCSMTSLPPAQLTARAPLGKFRCPAGGRRLPLGCASPLCFPMPRM